MSPNTQFRRAVAAVLCLSLFAVSPTWAQASSASSSALKAAFLYKFATFVEWPAGTFQKPDQPLVIAVMGDDDIAADLEQIVAGRTVDGRPVVAKRVSTTAAAQGANVLFVGGAREHLRETIEAVAGPVLVVTDQPSGLQSGAVLNFSDASGRIRFSASLVAADARRVRLSSRLLAVAENVEGRSR